MEPGRKNCEMRALQSGTKKENKDEQKSPMAPSTLKQLDAADPEKLKEKAEKVAEEIGMLKDSIANSEKAAKLCSPEFQEMQKSHRAKCEERLKELEKIDLDLDAEKDGVKLQKAFLGDIFRQNNNYEQKRRQAEEDHTKAKKKMELLTLKKAAQIEEEKQRHADTMLQLEEGFTKALTKAAEEVTSMEKKAKTIEEEYQQHKDWIATEQARTAPKEVAAKIEATSLAKLGTAAMEVARSNAPTAAIINTHLDSDASLAGIHMEEAQATHLMGSIQTLLQSQMTAFLTAWQQKMLEGEDSDGLDEMDDEEVCEVTTTKSAGTNRAKTRMASRP